MRRVLLFLCMMPLIATAQIGHITTQENRHEFIHGSLLYRMTATDEYILQIVSSNEFEDTAIKLKLGHSPEEAMESMANLWTACNEEESKEFKVQGYDFVVGKYGSIYARHLGPLLYTAGDYELNRSDLADAMIDLILTKNMPVGKAYFSVYKIAKDGKVFLHLNFSLYHFRKLVAFLKNFPKLSQGYYMNEIISDEDMVILFDNIPDNVINKDLQQRIMDYNHEHTMQMDTIQTDTMNE